MSQLEDLLAFQLKASGYHFEREYRWAAALVGHGKGIRERLIEAGLKDWRFDFADSDTKWAVEVEGGAWTQGRHTRGKGFHDDLVKYSEAMKRGWNIYRCDGVMVRTGEALAAIEAMIVK